MTVRRALGEKVVDLSIKQLTEPTTAEWRTADLKTDDRLVDVKNARFKADGRQVWHAVNRFKIDGWGNGVAYDGVRSQLRLIDSYGGESRPGDVIYLGTITRRRLSELAHTGTSRIDIEVERFEQDRTRLPGWCFELPAEAYAEHLQAAEGLAACRRATGYNADVNGAAEAVVAASFGFAPEEHSDSVSLRSVGPRMLDMARLVGSRGRWPALLIVHLLAAFLDEVAGLARFNDLNPAILFYPSRQFPLAVYDPTESVYAFHGLLRDLLKTGSNSLGDVRKLRLRGPKWLDAVSVNGEEYPLIVNCGGCNAFPLIRGIADFCPHGGGRLLCSCGWCPHAGFRNVAT